MINPADFLDIALELSKDAEASEARYRTAISRAYYAAYHETQSNYAKLKNLDLSERIFSNHQLFIRELQSQPQPVKKLGNQLSALKSTRVKADYKLTQSVTHSTARVTCAQASKIIEAAQQLEADRS